MRIEDQKLHDSTDPREAQIAQRAPARERSGYQRPKVDVLSLSCEISAYAPDEDGQPLF